MATGTIDGAIDVGSLSKLRNMRSGIPKLDRKRLRREEHILLGEHDTDAPINPYVDGTNRYLSDYLGLKHEDISALFAAYHKHEVQAAARIHSQIESRIPRGNLVRELYQLAEAIHWLGEDYTSTLVVRSGITPSDVVNGRAVEGIIKDTALTTDIRNSLELLAANEQVASGHQLVVGRPPQTVYLQRTARR